MSRSFVIHVPEDFHILRPKAGPRFPTSRRSGSVSTRPLFTDLDRAFFAAELLRDRLEVLVAYGPDALEAEMGTDRAKALTSVLDELSADDSEWNLVRHAL